jgi:outer membrane protein OmpA-like peptidoglycan-associated protein
MYTSGLNLDRSHNYVAISRNSHWGAYAAQWINAGVDEIDGRDIDGDPLGEFDFNDNALALSLAKRFDIASVGITGKYLSESIGADVSDDAANGFGVDLGAGLSFSEWVRFGLSVQNIAGELGSVENVNEIPPTLRAGIALWPMRGLTTALDVEKTRDEEDYKLHVGGELAMPLSEDLGAALRIGINDGDFAGGVGFSFNVVRFDYAYVVEPAEFLDENHRFSLSLVFGEDEMRGYYPGGRKGDRDNDGVLDGADACPDAAEDFDGFADTDGCPDPDNDGDGILDVNDDCPTQAEDFDGFQDTDGCPDPDNDGDGVLDINDRCPDQAETFNNFDDADGCPDSSPTMIPMLAYINFKFGTAEISGADPIPVLEEVARIMRERPEIRLKITGHTDNVGSDSANMQLSMRRAEAVRNYLVQKGVSSDRFVLDGKGESTPIDTNDTEIGRARNRRIEFSVVQ